MEISVFRLYSKLENEMDWNKLMSKKRLGQRYAQEDSVVRTDFQKDYDRIAFSSAFRRLQDKAQVFPLSDNDYVRTRLTHSLEVSCVGRSLGTMIGEKVIKKYNLIDLKPEDFGVVTSTACLAHDIGNTPLGHSGEYAIREWFKNSEIGKKIIHRISDKQKQQDFLQYQGNAQGFRFLTKLQWPSSPGGLQLTYATLGALSKYPRKSWIDDIGLNSIYGGKFSFFYDDQSLFEEVAVELGLDIKGEQQIWCRHPLTYLVEAADDICYHIVDVEDGHRLGQISFEEAKELLLKLVDERRANKKLYNMRNEKDIVECLRAMAVGYLIGEVEKLYVDNLESITNGEYNYELTRQIPCSEVFLEFKKIAEKKIYTARRVVEIEAAGFSVVERLLDCFLGAIEDKYAQENEGKKMSRRSKTIIQLIPESFIGHDKTPDADAYKRSLKIVDYVSGMTDSFAVSVFKKISGILI
jgi:dGTPase